MGHKNETQTHSEDVPNTIRRNGTYYYRRRIPSDLVAAHAFGETKTGKPRKFLKYSLKTKDPRTARRMVAQADLRAEEQFEEKRQEIEASQPAEFIRRRNRVGHRTVPLASLSEVERQDLIFREFITLQRQSQEQARRAGESEHITRSEWLEEAKNDLSALSGDSKKFEPIDWDSRLSAFLEAEGIGVGDADQEAFSGLRALLKQAHVEDAWRMVQTLQGKTQSENDPAFRGIGAHTPIPEMRERQGVSVGALCESYREARQKAGMAPRTLASYEPQIRIVCDFFGANTPVHSITLEEARRFVDFLAVVPVNSAKRYPDVSITTASKREAKKKSPAFLSSKTQSVTFSGVAAIFRYAVEMEWIAASPLAKKVVRSRLPRVEKGNKPMFTAPEMSALFASSSYLSQRDDAHHRDRGDARFWVPLLCLFHGFRSNEVCTLLVSDVKKEDGIDFLHLRETDDEGRRVKRLKTYSSRRKVPIHAELLKMGFLEFVDAQRKRGVEFLYPGLKENRLGSKADAVGKWFARLRKKIVDDLPDVRGAKGLHSFRHSFRRACREAEIPREIVWAIGGWTGGSQRNSAEDYGSGYSVKQLKRAIDKVEFPGTDFSPLYPHDNQ